MNVELRPLLNFPEHIDGVVEWLRAEWGAETGRDHAATRQRLLHVERCPPPTLALSEDVPVGLVAFRRFRRGGDVHQSLFIDVLYVHEAARSRGVGTRLLEDAVLQARAHDSTLYVFTDKRSWYEHRGWTFVRTKPGTSGSVLVRNV